MKKLLILGSVFAMSVVGLQSCKKEVVVGKPVADKKAEFDVSSLNNEKSLGGDFNLKKAEQSNGYTCQPDGSVCTEVVIIGQRKDIEHLGNFVAISTNAQLKLILLQIK